MVAALAKFLISIKPRFPRLVTLKTHIRALELSSEVYFHWIVLMGSKSQAIKDKFIMFGSIVIRPFMTGNKIILNKTKNNIKNK